MEAHSLRGSFSPPPALRSAGEDPEGIVRGEPIGVRPGDDAAGFVARREDAPVGACEEGEPLGERVGSERVAAAQVMLGGRRFDEELVDDGLFSGTERRGQVLDELRDAATAACSAPDVLRLALDAGAVEPEPDDVDRAGVQGAIHGFEVADHRAVGGEVTERVDGAEREVGARGELEMGEVGREERRAERTPRDGAAGEVDHGGVRIEADGVRPALREGAQVAPRSARGFEPAEGAAPTPDRTPEIPLRDADEPLDLGRGAGGVKNVVPEGVVVPIGLDDGDTARGIALRPASSGGHGRRVPVRSARGAVSRGARSAA